MDEELRQDIFIDAYSKPLPEYLLSLEKEALKDSVPIIRKESQYLLRFLLSSKKPLSILEIGTAVGFSSLLFAEYTSKDCKIVTVENYEPRIEKAKKYFSEFDKDKKITLIEGDAGEVLKGLDGDFDFIFLDGPKGQYDSYLKDLLRILKKDGLLITDNIFKEGDILESKFAIERRDRTIHSRMREFLLSLRDNEELENVILPSGDGMTITVKK